MYSNTMLFLQLIIYCGLSYGMESQGIHDYPHNFKRDSIQRSLNLELSKITHQVQIGHHVELDCGTTDSKSTSSSTSPITWHFKACGHGFNQLSCNKAIDTGDSNSWEKLQCSPNNNCSSSLAIASPTEKDSGLYRCSIYPFKPTLEIQVVKTYFLDVRNTTIPPPDIVDGPTNTTALIDTQVVLQCCVSSRIRPRITWFKRQNAPLTSSARTTNDTIKIIEYSEYIYLQLESAGEKVLNDGVYLSKLILNGITEQDGGFYVCVAINYGGYKMQEAYLSVLDSLEEASEEHGGIHSLFLLFLIPVGLALAPLSLWICYLLFRKQEVKEFDSRTDTKGNDYVKVNRNIV